MRMKSKLGVEYDLINALLRNPTIIKAGDDISAVAIDKIEGLQADLESAVRVARKHGATEWADANYPDIT